MQTKKITDHIVKWLSDYAVQACVKGYVVGVSGGVDSGVVSALCAMTGLEVLLLEMPIRQKEDQVSRAREHIEDLKKKFLNVRSQQVNLTPVFGSFEKTIGEVDQGNTNKNLALANTRSRLRMLCLYYYAQVHGLLVCGTGNKVEDFGVGFFTKYGDGGVDVSPIADLYKTEVYALAKALNLSESIQNAVPTDGLWDIERTDEEQIGARYAELEKIQKEYGTKAVEEYKGRDKEVYLIFDRLHKANQHKMKAVPICRILEEWR
ncbi:MAG: NAD(+) synthase [Bergeyella sp.]|nr:NAD(+) synthase [Bergeyella sp.]